MFARVRVTQGVPDKLDEGIRQFREAVVPSYKNVTGFKGGYMLVDRAKGKLIGVTLWVTEADLRATEATSQRLRTVGSHAAGGAVESVEVMKWSWSLKVGTLTARTARLPYPRESSRRLFPRS